MKLLPAGGQAGVNVAEDSLKLTATANNSRAAEYCCVYACWPEGLV